MCLFVLKGLFVCKANLLNEEQPNHQRWCAKMKAQLEHLHIACTFSHVPHRFLCVSRCIINKTSASELSRRFTKSALLLVGSEYFILLLCSGSLAYSARELLLLLLLPPPPPPRISFYSADEKNASPPPFQPLPTGCSSHSVHCTCALCSLVGKKS